MQCSNSDAPPKLCAVLSHTPPFMRGFACRPGQVQQPVWQSTLPIFLCIKYFNFLADNFFSCIPFNILRTGVPVLNDTICIQKNNGIVLHFCYHLVIPFFTGTQLVVRYFLVCKVACHLAKSDHNSVPIVQRSDGNTPPKPGAILPFPPPFLACPTGVPCLLQ